MRLEIAQLGQPVLRNAAREVTAEEIRSAEFQQLIADMHETLRLEKGAGLAAPQVFRDLRVFAAAILPPVERDGDPEIETLINPRLVGASAEEAEGWEGCLSFPELVVLVPRRWAVRIEYVNPRGDWCVIDAADFPARVLQHEYDHLEGVLTLDRAKSSRHIVKASELDAFLGKEKKPETRSTATRPETD
jgi:peptide deformylase